MSNGQHEAIDEPAPHPQVNKVRGEYVDGEMSETELEIQLEDSLSKGPSLCSQVVGEKDWTTLERLSSYAQAVVLIPFARFADWKLGDDGDVTYYLRQHTIVNVDHDPDPDDHPAESAGVTRSLLDMVCLWVYCWGSVIALDFSLTVGLGLALMFGLCAVGRRVSVRHTDAGVGTHVAD